MKSFLVGSLPFRDIHVAIDYSFAFSVPTLCSLPKLDQDEFMVDQALRETENFDYINHRLVKNPKKNHNAIIRFSCEREFFQRLEDNATYKWQACGPLTLASSLDHHPEEKMIMESFIQKLLRTQRRFNKNKNAKCLFFIDEPVLAFAGEGEFLYEFIERLRQSEEFKTVTIGLHTCSKASPLLLANLDIDIYSLDMSLFNDEEKKTLQYGLGRKLVYAPVGSNGELYEYSQEREEYVSAACGHALAPIEKMDAIRERIRAFESP